MILFTSATNKTRSRCGHDGARKQHQTPANTSKRDTNSKTAYLPGFS